MKKFIKKHPLILIAVLYLLLPWDFLPDLLGLVGFSDDLVVSLLIFLKEYLKHRKEEAKIAAKGDKVKEEA